MDDLDWDDLRFYIVLSHTGSLSATARVLDVEHSTVVRRLTRLEKTIGVKLFNRMARGWTLTAEGQELASRAQILEQEILAIRRFAIATGEIAGDVRLSAPPALLNELVIPVLDGLRADLPEISLILKAEMRDVDLTRGEADIALRMSEPTNAELVFRVIYQVEYGLYGTRKWADVSPAERHFIGFLQDQRTSLAAKLDKHVGERRYVIRSNDIWSIKSAIQKGYGIGILPKFMVHPEDGLHVLDGLASSLSSAVYMVMQRDVRQSPRVRAVADHLWAAFKKRDAKMMIA